MAKQQVDIEVRGVDKGASSLLDGLAQKAKQLRREDALSGEKALGGFLNRGVGGAAELGMSALGFGAAGLVANFFADASANLTQAMIDVRDGKQTLTDAFAEFAKGIPIVGGLGKSLANLFELMTGTSQKAAILESQQRALMEQRNSATAVGLAAGAAAKSASDSAAVDYLNATQDPATAARVMRKEKMQEEVKALEEQRKNVEAIDFKFATEKKARIDALDKAIKDKRDAFYAQEAKDARDQEQQQSQAAAAFYSRMLGLEAGAKEALLSRNHMNADAAIVRIRETYRKQREDLDTRGGNPEDIARARLALQGQEVEAIISARDESFHNRQNAREQIADAQQRIHDLLNPASNYSAHGEQAIGGRFSTGQNELLLMRTANTDTARNTGEMLREIKKLNEQIADLNRTIESNTEHSDSYNGGN